MKCPYCNLNLSPAYSSYSINIECKNNSHTFSYSTISKFWYLYINSNQLCKSDIYFDNTGKGLIGDYQTSIDPSLLPDKALDQIKRIVNLLSFS